MDIKYNEKNEVEMPVFANLDQNVDALESLFKDWGDIVRKRFLLEREDGYLSIYIIYIDGLTDNEMVERTITRPFLFEWRSIGSVIPLEQKAMNPNSSSEMKVSHQYKRIVADEQMFSDLFHNQAEAVDLTEKTTMMDVLDGVLKGDTAIFVDGVEKAMVLSTKKFPTRAVNFPQRRRD